MIDFDSISTREWIRIYEILDDDGHLSESGKEELKRLNSCVYVKNVLGEVRKELK